MRDWLQPVTTNTASTWATRQEAPRAEFVLHCWSICAKKLNAKLPKKDRQTEWQRERDTERQRQRQRSWFLLFPLTRAMFLPGTRVSPICVGLSWSTCCCSDWQQTQKVILKDVVRISPNCPERQKFLTQQIVCRFAQHRSYTRTEALFLLEAFLPCCYELIICWSLCPGTLERGLQIVSAKKQSTSFESSNVKSVSNSRLLLEDVVQNENLYFHDLRHSVSSCHCHCHIAIAWKRKKFSQMTCSLHILWQKRKSAVESSLATWADLPLRTCLNYVGQENHFTLSYGPAPGHSSCWVFWFVRSSQARIGQRWIQNILHWPEPLFSWDPCSPGQMTPHNTPAVFTRGTQCELGLVFRETTMFHASGIHASQMGQTRSTGKFTAAYKDPKRIIRKHLHEKKLS